MHWLYLMAGLACFGLAMMRNISTPVVLLFLAGAFGFILAWIVGMLRARISSQSRDIAHIMGPDELRKLREQAEARRNAASKPPTDTAP